MLFCQLTGADSLREISDGLYSSLGKLSHIGATAVCRSTLSYANSKRPYKLYEDFYYVLLEKFRHEIQGRLGNKFTKPVFSLDSTTISLCLRLFEWAQHRRRKGGIKLHTLLNNDTSLPEVIVETTAKTSDIKGAKGILENIWAQHRRRKGGIKLHTLLNNDTSLPEVIVETTAKTSDIKGAKGILENIPPGSIVVMDRGYNDYSLSKRLTDKGVVFVTRLKDNAQHTPLRQGLIKTDPGGCWGLYEMKFTGAKAKLHCSDTNFRVVQWLDKETNRWFEFLTNSQELSATEVADLYKERWQIELFFKRIKQNLVIKTFVGTTENAVMTQIWTAAIAILLLELMKERWQIELFFKRIKQNLVIKTFVGTTENAVMTQIWTAAIAILLLELMRRRSTYKWTYCRLARYFKLNLMTCKCLLHWLNQLDIKEWEKPPKLAQLSLFD